MSRMSHEPDLSESLSRFLDDPLGHLPDVPPIVGSGTIAGTIRLDGVCPDFTANNLTVVARATDRQSRGVTQPTYETQPNVDLDDVDVPGPDDFDDTDIPDDGFGGSDNDGDDGDELRDVTYTYDLEVPSGAYAVSVRYDGDYDGEWDRGDGFRVQLPVAVAVSPFGGTATADFTYRMYPEITLYAFGDGEIDVGGSAILNCLHRNVERLTVEPGVGEIDPDETVEVSPDRETTYTATAVGPAGTRTDTATVSIAPPEIPEFSASADSVSLGDAVKLTWETENASSVSIDPAIKDRGDGVPQPDDWAWDTPRTDTTYELTATNPDGDEATATVDVEVEPPTIDYFRASETDVERGDAVRFEWKVRNASTVRIDPDIKQRGDGTPRLEDHAWDRPTETRTYTLTAENPDGEEVTATVTVSVEQPPTATITATPDKILRGYGEAELTWRAENASTVTLDGDTVSATGSREVEPSSTEWYTLTATDGSEEAEDTAQVGVYDRIYGTTDLTLPYDRKESIYNSNESEYFYKNTSMFYEFQHEALPTAPKPDPYVTAIKNESGFDVLLELMDGDDVVQNGAVGIDAGETVDTSNGGQTTIDLDWRAKLQALPRNKPDEVELTVAWRMEA